MPIRYPNVEQAEAEHIAKINPLLTLMSVKSPPSDGLQICKNDVDNNFSLKEPTGSRLPVNSVYSTSTGSK